MSDEDLLWQAIALAWECPVSDTAFSVGALIVVDGRVRASGYSRQEQPADHAEEVALRHVAGDLTGATVYSSLEPCGRRASRPRSCADLLIAAGVARVVFAWAEPDVFVPATGAAKLRAAGVAVTRCNGLASAAAEPNAHLLGA